MIKDYIKKNILNPELKSAHNVHTGTISTVEPAGENDARQRYSIRLWNEDDEMPSTDNEASFYVDDINAGANKANQGEPYEAGDTVIFTNLNAASEHVEILRKITPGKAEEQIILPVRPINYNLGE